MVRVSWNDIFCQLQSSDTLDRATLETTGIKGRRKIEVKNVRKTLARVRREKHAVQDKNLSLIRNAHCPVAAHAVLFSLHDSHRTVAVGTLRVCTVLLHLKCPL
jgi:hypothetical protein